MAIPEINISDYTYDLPEDRIASYPVAERDASKLLIYNKGVISDTVFSHLPEIIPSGSLMVFRYSVWNRRNRRITIFALRLAKRAYGTLSSVIRRSGKASR